jgi:mxaJ protein
MCSLFRSLLVIVLAAPAFAAGTLKVCADPDNLPYSDKAGRGFENHLAKTIASELKQDVEFVWARPRRGFVRERMNKSECDLLVSVPVGFHGVLTTKPYLRSSYVFVAPADKHLDISSFDDPRLKQMKIGVQALDDEYAPPAQALGRRGLLANIVGYEPFGKVPGKIVSDVATGKLDVAVVWGPFAGFYAKRSRRKLKLTPVEPDHDGVIPFAYELAVGVNRSDPALLQQINEVLQREHERIAALMQQYGVPQLPLEEKMEARR